MVNPGDLLQFSDKLERCPMPFSASLHSEPIIIWFKSILCNTKCLESKVRLVQ